MSGEVPEKATEEDLLFLSWLSENGASFPKLKWPVYSWPGQPHDGERGVMVTEDIQPGERMFSIPGCILLNREKCLASDIGGVFRKHRAQLFSERDELALSLLLLYEKLDKGRESFWWPMIQALPKDPGSAALWGDSELALLQDDVLRAEALLKPRIIADTHKKVILPIIHAHPEHFTAARYTEAEFRWALLCVESRTFGRFLPHPSITPFADLLNHVNVHTSYRWDPLSEMAIYSCDASGRFPHTKGAEAFMSYGPRTNRELLLHYGFALDNNEHDTCSLQFRVSKCVGKKKTLRTMQVELRHGRPCLPALALFRELSGSALAAKSTTPGLVSAAGIDTPMYLRKSEETRTLEWLRDTYKQVLDWFGSDVEADVLALTLQTDHRRRFAILYCIGRKRLLLSQIRFLELALKRLDAAPVIDMEPEGLVDCSYLVSAFEDFIEGGSEEDLCDMFLSDARGLKKDQSAALEIRKVVEVPLPQGCQAVGMSCGSGFTAVVGSEGELYTFGSNRMAKLGHSRTEFDVTPHVMLPKRVIGLADHSVISVGCGGDHVVALTSDGMVWCWGANTSGQCGLKHKCTQVLQPTNIDCEFFATSVACGEEFNLVTTKEGECYAWGRNYEGQCGIGTVKGASGSIHVPSRVQTSVEFVQVYAGRSEACGITEDGELWCWGCAIGGRLGVGSLDGMPLDADGEPHVPAPVPAVFKTSSNCTVSCVCVGPKGVVLLDREGGMYYSGGYPLGEGGDAAECECFTGLAAPSGAPPLALVSWAENLAVVHSDGVVSVAGDVNEEGQPVWRTLACPGKVDQIACGLSHQVLVSQGRVLSVGSAESGEAGLQLGLGSLNELLQDRVSKGLVNVANSHPGVVCCVCKCETIKGVRYLSVSSPNVDVCGTCIDSASGAHLIAQNAFLVCHRRLPKNLRPQLPFTKFERQETSNPYGMCAECGVAIQNCSFVCGNCVGYSLCRACHNTPTRCRHPSSHVFILVGFPIDTSALPRQALLPNLFPQLTADVFQ